MSADAPKQIDRPAGIGGNALSTDTRIDGPHVLGSRASSSPGEPRQRPATISDSSGSTVADAKSLDVRHEDELLEQVELQAAQLARRLQSWQCELDRREARLNAQEAELESSARAARLWLAERHTELDQRTSELDKRCGALGLHKAQWRWTADGGHAESPHTEPTTHASGPADHPSEQTSGDQSRRFSESAESQATLEALRDELVEQHDRLLTHASRLRRWFQQRRQELNRREEHLRRRAATSHPRESRPVS